MRFRSAKEDLHQTTLAALRGRLERLRYLADLRLASGAYEHWGMTRVYGDAQSQAALHGAHLEALDALLRAPLAELYAEGQPRGFDFARPAAEMLPPGTGALRAAHFSLVWDALASVARRRASRRPAA